MWGIVLPLGIVAIVMVAVVEIVRVAVRSWENVERIRHGYPTLEGKTSYKHPAILSGDDRSYVDMTDRGGN